MVRDRFELELVQLHDELDDMANIAKGMLRDGIIALEQQDPDLADEVIERENSLADLDERLETEILSLLAREAPMAGDLRRMGTSLKLITYINRVGRYGYDIAKETKKWPEGRPHVARMVNLRDMAAKVEAMMALCIQAFREEIAPDTDAITEFEDDVDSLRYSVWRECLTYMWEDPKNIEPCATYMMVARYLERCGDNVCKMAEKLHYAATGERIMLN